MDLLKQLLPNAFIRNCVILIAACLLFSMSERAGESIGQALYWTTH
ncbi:hypothetical protein [Massilia sp. Leaf139]|nr:hypothetical protein [Massilia sp. Leaf139]